ncbi:hypothetical protein [Raineyella sp.]|uniref:DUF4352 domain-containing protein n=1 Tax=bioreactor metagenome TaxID=1076179 RepID=A0A645BT66_9ZZZZ|nr:hypothetical protein [Raineyella sp.]MEA5155099.1 hypothetical protein [Raineyella sp.]
MAKHDGSTARIRTYITGVVLMVAVVAAALIGDRLDRSSSSTPGLGAGSSASAGTPPRTTGPGTPTDRPLPPTAGPRSRSTTPSSPARTGLPISGQWIDYQSSEGTGRLAVTDHRRRGKLTELDVVLAATSGYQSYILWAYDDSGNRYLPVSDQESPLAVGSGVIAAGETLTGQLSFEAPAGPLTLVLRNDRNEAVGALRVG